MIDIQDATGSIKSLPPKRKEEAVGQLMSVDVEPTIDLFVTPQQFDGFYDRSRGLASELYWIPPGPNAKDKAWYLRWFNLKKFGIEVPSKLEHMLKLATVKLKEESDSDYSRSRIEVVLPCFPGSCMAELSSQQARLTLKVKGHCSVGDHMKLLDLFRREKLNISFYQRQEDLQASTATPPREEAPAAPPALPTDDKLYPKLVEFIELAKSTDEACLTVPDVTKKLRVGINRALELLAAAVRAGVVLEKNEEGEYLFPPVAATTDAATSAQSPEGDAPPAPGQPATPKCVQEWDGEQWVDNAGARIEPQPPAPEFTNVRDLGASPPDDGEPEPDLE
jgi:hypothetical protein